MAMYNVQKIKELTLNGIARHYKQKGAISGFWAFRERLPPAVSASRREKGSIFSTRPRREYGCKLFLSIRKLRMKILSTIKGYKLIISLQFTINLQV